MNQLSIVILVAVVSVLIVVLAFAFSRKRRREKLRERFGPEYDRVLEQEKDVRKAEGVLEFRARRREQFEIHPLSTECKSSYAGRWGEVQARFVDDPRGAVTLADHLVTDVIQARGYPVGEFEQQAADLSADYPTIVDSYRAAHEIAERHRAGQATTEDLRQAMVHYRALFQELLEERHIEKKGA